MVEICQSHPEEKAFDGLTDMLLALHFASFLQQIALEFFAF
jgi:hypothetical protein